MYGYRSIRPDCFCWTKEDTLSFVVRRKTTIILPTLALRLICTPIKWLALPRCLRIGAFCLPHVLLWVQSTMSAFAFCIRRIAWSSEYDWFQLFIYQARLIQYTFFHENHVAFSFITQMDFHVCSSRTNRSALKPFSSWNKQWLFSQIFL